MLSAKYDRVIDRDSAFERLQARAEAAAKAAAEAEEAEERLKEEERRDREDRRYNDRTTGRSSSRKSTSRRSDSVLEAFGKSVARQLGTKTGQAIVRGILGSIFKSR